MKPILFNTEMVQAILSGQKTVTRRPIKPAPKSPLVCVSGKWLETQPCANGVRCIAPPYRPGDILYVRETWSPVFVRPKRYIYKADCNEVDPFLIQWHPSIHMPKEAARLFLRVKAVYAERLKEISASSAMDEGVTDWKNFVALWDSTIKTADIPLDGWAANPWVWVIEFERISEHDNPELV